MMNNRWQITNGECPVQTLNESFAGLCAGEKSMRPSCTRRTKFRSGL